VRKALDCERCMKILYVGDVVQAYTCKLTRPWISTATHSTMAIWEMCPRVLTQPVGGIDANKTFTAGMASVWP